MNSKRFSFSSKTVVWIILLLLVVNLAIGILLATRSSASAKALISEHMLGVAETAASLLDGDELAALTERDAGGPRQQAVIDRLTFFSEHLDFQYIYVVRPDDSGDYVFIADADPVAPAVFGEEIVTSPALLSAGSGVAAVDDEPVGDRWGKYFTAYCPVPDSAGQIGGIVGVDFDAARYEDWMAKNTLYLLLSCAVSLLFGGGVMLLVNSRLRKRFDTLHVEMSSMAADLGSLMEEVTTESGYAMTTPEADLLSATAAELAENRGAVTDSVERLAGEIQIIKRNLKRYIAFVHEQAFTDGMTGVGSKTAYLEVVRELDEKIGVGEADFSIAVFDVNGLKTVNDDYGHESGDDLITGVSDCIKRVFGARNVFRIGGDEFIAVLSDFSEEDMTAAFGRLDSEVAQPNAGHKDPDQAPITFSRGAATFRPGEDKSFREVFKRADETMYRNKAEYYMSHGDRRKT